LFKRILKLLPEGEITGRLKYGKDGYEMTGGFSFYKYESPYGKIICMYFKKDNLASLLNLMGIELEK